MLDFINRLILVNAESARQKLVEDHAFDVDKNGPWQEEVTPVRICCHWSILLIYAWKISGDKGYLAVALDALEILYIKDCRPYGALYLCRLNKNKNATNGLVGQAWICEALIEAYLATNEMKYLDRAVTIIKFHEFNSDDGLWMDSDLSGQAVRVNRTINQQIFFSAVARKVATLAGLPAVRKCCDEFWLRFGEQVAWYKQGIVHHKVNTKNKSAGVRFRELLDFKRWGDQSIGYLSFILYGLALEKIYNGCLAQCLPYDVSEVIRKVLAHVDREYPFLEHRSMSSFGWSYNPTGIEVAIALNVFKDTYESVHSVNEWLTLQFQLHADEKGFMKKATIDPAILSARVYQVVRLIC